jgi:MFS transporter, CP family, cyanate transporter
MKRSRSAGAALLLPGIIAKAFNLRPALAAVGPLVGQIRADTGLSNATLGFLTTLPLLAFGVGSAFTPRLTRRIGIEAALALALGLLAAGTFMRAAPALSLLFGGTLVLGVGITLGNVLLPALVKRDFPGRSGFMTGLYSSVMGFGATVAAGVSVPISNVLGWRGALAIWAAPTALALVLWLPRVVRGRAARSQAEQGGSPITRSPGTAPGARGPEPPAAEPLPVPPLPTTPRRSLLSSKLAWHVALFMGLQSLTFYVVLAWLPDLLQGRGRGAGPARGGRARARAAPEAGWLLALAQATGVIGSATIPLWAGRLEDLRRVVWVLGALEAVSLAGALVPGLTALAAVWVSILGFVLGGTFGLALLLLVVRAADTAAATQLSGMAQSVGYLIAAAGPVLFGLIRDVTGGWTASLLFLTVVLAGKVASGVGAGRPGRVRGA